MTPYPTTLTTSDWVDYLATCPTRDAQIAALATYHRRIEWAAKHAALNALIDPDPDSDDAVTQAAKRERARIADPADYE